MKSENTYTRNAGGFTLLEVMFASILIGLVIAALAASSGAFTMANGYGVDLSTAEFLIEEVREKTTTLTYAEVYAYAEGDINPPIDISGAQMPEFSAFTQNIVIENVSAANFEQVVSDGTSDFLRVTVTIKKNNKPISSASWIRANY